MIIELHIVQNFAPSCLNRDDLNAPKECEFGGERRARISSQSLKRAARMHPGFSSAVAGAVGKRTKLLEKELVDYIVARGKAADLALKAVEPVVAAIGSGLEEGRTSVMLYVGRDEIKRIGDAIEARFDELVASSESSGSEESEASTKGKAKKPNKGSGSAEAQKLVTAIRDSFKPGTKAADIALFGRMVAESTDFNIDAAAQVAHAISTHGVASEFDFFTAVDDLQPAGTIGAGMMGTQQFNSATFYRYANVHLNQLGTNLGGDADLARAAALAFVESFILAIPSAKQNSHAAHNPPDLVFAVVRSPGAALSLANAFVKPVHGKAANGLVIESIRSLAKYWSNVTKCYGAQGIVAAPFFAVPDECNNLTIEHAKKVEGLSPLLAELRSSLASWNPESQR